MGRGTHRGFITYEELNKSLGKRNLSDENNFILVYPQGSFLEGAPTLECMSKRRRQQK